jgi:hypothetical protein
MGYLQNHKLVIQFSVSAVNTFNGLRMLNGHDLALLDRGCEYCCRRLWRPRGVEGLVRQDNRLQLDILQPLFIATNECWRHATRLRPPLQLKFRGVRKDEREVPARHPPLAHHPLSQLLRQEVLFEKVLVCFGKVEAFIASEHGSANGMQVFLLVLELAQQFPLGSWLLLLTRWLSWGPSPELASTAILPSLSPAF